MRGGEQGGIVIHIQHLERNVRAAEQPSSISCLSNEFVACRYFPVRDCGSAKFALGHKWRGVFEERLICETYVVLL